MDKTISISLSGVKKRYRLGQLGGGTLNADLQSWLARLRGREDPNRKIGEPARGEFWALQGIDLTVYKGETLGIIGPNGAGKSTLLKLLSQVTAPTEGQIRLGGRVASMLEVGTGFHGEMTGRENVYLNGAILGMTREEIDAKLADIIAFSEVGPFIDTPVKRYSSGMYVKLAFAVAAHLDSEILILDEVLAVGDLAFQKKCLEKMRAAAETEGRTVLYVSHNMHTIRTLCDRCIVLDQGKIVFDGDVEQAIALYAGSGAARQVTCCAHWPREAICRGGARITRTEIPGDSPVLWDEAPLKLRIWYQADRKIPDLRVRMILFSQRGSPVGMARAPGHAARMGENRVALTFEVSHLAPGIYRGRLVLFQENGSGEQILDVADPGVIFQKEWRTGLWKPQVWGDLRFPEAVYETDKTLCLLEPESGG